MQDLYKGFKKVSEDNQSAVLEHENGHRLNIAKNGLSRRQKAALHKLPLHQARGTEEVPVQTEMQPESNPAEKLQNVGAQIADAVAENMVRGAEQAITPQQIEQMPDVNAMDVETGQPVAKSAGKTPEIKRAPLPPGPLAAFNPLNVPDMMPGETGTQYAARKQKEYDDYWGVTQSDQQEQENQVGLAEGVDRQGAEEIAEVPTKVAEMPEEKPMVAPPAPVVPTAPRIARPLTDEETIASPSTSMAQKMAAFGNLSIKTIKDKQELRKEYLKVLQEPIEAKKMYGDGFLRNVATVVALLMGGASAGITGKENPVIRMIDQDIERDLQLQRQNKEDKLSIFNQNMAMLDDEREAYIQSANAMREAYIAGIEEAKWRIDPRNFAAQEVMDTALRELKAKRDELDAAEAMRLNKQKIMNAMENTGGVSDMDPAQLVPIMIDNDADRRKVFEEIDDMQRVAQSSPQLLRLFDQAAKDNTALRTIKVPYIGALGKLPESVSSYQALLNQLIKTQGPARDAEVMRVFKSVTPEPYDSEADVELKRKTLKDYLKGLTTAPTARAYGMDLNKFSRTKYSDPMDLKSDQMKEYARQNKNSADPEKRRRAEFIIRKYGE